MSKKLRPMVYLFFVTFILDRFSKFWVFQNLKEKTLFLTNNLNFVLVKNRGISWGLLNSHSSALFNVLKFVIFAIIIIFLIHTYLFFKKGKSIFFETLILSGAISNLIDRFMYNGVIDFIEFHIGSWSWPVFNLADSFLVIGIFGILGRHLYNVYVRKIESDLF